MLISKTLKIAVLAALMPITAQAWQHEKNRGVDLYQTSDENLSVSLVCDPNAVYGTTVSAVLVGVRLDDDISGPVTLRFPDLIVVQANLSHGRIAKADNEAGIWPALLTGLRAHGSVEISLNGSSYTVNLGDPLPFSCT